VYSGPNHTYVPVNLRYSAGWQQTSEVHYVYDGNVVLQERDANNWPTVSYTRGQDLSGTFEGAGGIGGLLARTDMALWVLGTGLGAASPHAYYHCDGNGNITCLINTNQGVAARYLYDPFGNILSQSGQLADANLYRFSGKETHVNSGIAYYLYRFYDPNLQRWLNRDPAGERAGYNLYVCVLNNPIGCIDALGLAVGDKYPTLIIAAKDAGAEARSMTQQTGYEYGGYLYQNPEKTTYSYTRNTSHKRHQMDDLGPPPGANSVCAWYHSHPEISGIFGEFLTLLNSNFSGDDKQATDNLGVPGFLATPIGGLKEYFPDPAKGRNGQVVVITSPTRNLDPDLGRPGRRF